MCQRQKITPGLLSLQPTSYSEILLAWIADSATSPIILLQNEIKPDL